MLTCTEYYVIGIVFGTSASRMDRLSAHFPNMTLRFSLAPQALVVGPASPAGLQTSMRKHSEFQLRDEAADSPDSMPQTGRLMSEGYGAAFVCFGY